MIRTMIIDDEPRNIKWVTKLMADHCPALQLTGTSDDLTEAILMVEKLKPDLLLLDIEFPPGSVFSFLDKLVYKDFQIVFITAYNTYASEAFRRNAVDYILKPVTKEALVEAVERVQEKIQHRHHADIAKLVEVMIHQRQHSAKIPVPSADGILFIDEKDILHCEASGRYTIIHLDGNKKFTITKTLKEIEHLLNPAEFFRIHHSHIINLTKVSKYHRSDGGSIELTDSSVISVSSSRRGDLMQVLMNRTGH